MGWIVRSTCAGLKDLEVLALLDAGRAGCA
jgi:hypothetical protein